MSQASGTTPVHAQGTLFPGTYTLAVFDAANVSTGLLPDCPPSSGSFTTDADVTFTLGDNAPTLNIGDVSQLEGTSSSTTFTFPVTLSAASTQAVTVSYGTQDGTATVADSDYNFTSGVLTFAPNETLKQVTVQVNGDTKPEGLETFSVVLSNPVNATIAKGTGLGTILNDDAVVDFDWTVPDRFDGLDHNGDGLVDYFGPDGSLVISPSRWRVDFTYTVDNACPAGDTDSWKVNGVTILPTSEPGVISDNPSACKFSYGFPAEGKYSVELQVKTAATGAVIGTKQHDVTVQDWLIVSIGDSVASGEGDPDVPGGDAARWENGQCHRSSFAGPAQAAMAIEKADKKTSVTSSTSPAPAPPSMEGCSGRSYQARARLRYRKSPSSTS